MIVPRGIRRSVEASALLVAPLAALAVPLALGDTALTGTTSAARPELAGTVIAEHLRGRPVSQEY